MSRQVFLENWQEQLEATIEDVSDRVSVYSFSPEQESLFLELKQLNELVRQVRDVMPNEREMVRSAVIAITVTESLQLPDDLVSRLGELFDIYRRFRTRLTWSL